MARPTSMMNKLLVLASLWRKKNILVRSLCLIFRQIFSRKYCSKTFQTWPRVAAVSGASLFKSNLSSEVRLQSRRKNAKSSTLTRSMVWKRLSSKIRTGVTKKFACWPSSLKSQAPRSTNGTGIARGRKLVNPKLEQILRGRKDLLLKKKVKWLRLRLTCKVWWVIRTRVPTSNLQ